MDTCRMMFVEILFVYCRCLLYNVPVDVDGSRLIWSCCSTVLRLSLFTFQLIFKFDLILNLNCKFKNSSSFFPSLPFSFSSSQKFENGKTPKLGTKLWNPNSIDPKIFHLQPRHKRIINTDHHFPLVIEQKTMTEDTEAQPQDAGENILVLPMLLLLRMMPKFVRRTVGLILEPSLLSS